MKVFKEKECRNCGTKFTPSAPATLYCKVCAPIMAKEAERRGSYAHKIRNNLINNPGVGKGGAQVQGKEHSCYTNGRNDFKRRRPMLLKERRYCERCNKDLKNISTYLYVIHHKDYNRDNNTEENYELLCKRCHQLEHDCIKNLQ